MKKLVNCFRKKGKGKLRHGIWVISPSEGGWFYHGDRDEVQASRYTLETLIEWSRLAPEEAEKDPSLGIAVELITPDEALQEISQSGWTGALSGLCRLLGLEEPNSGQDWTFNPAHDQLECLKKENMELKREIAELKNQKDWLEGQLNKIAELVQSFKNEEAS